MALDGGDAESVIAEFRALGIDDGALAEQLQKEGADAFAKSWKSLLDGIADKTSQLSGAARGERRARRHGRAGALPAWQALVAHHAEIGSLHLRELFASDPGRGERLVVEAAGLYLDYSKNRITDETMRRLVALAEARGLGERIAAMFRGDVINTTEKRPALHVALRMPEGEQARGRRRRCRRRGARRPRRHDVLRRGGAQRQLDRAHRQADQEHRQHRHRRLRPGPGHGLRGAALLRRPAPDAALRLQRRRHRPRRGDARPRRRETLFIVCSKTFTTLETLTNAHAARDWCVTRLGDEKAVAKHFVAVSTNAEGVQKFGIAAENMFGFWDWVGGRYSMDSAIGLSTLIAIGPENFDAMLAGFHAMDEHFRSAPIEKNMPALLGLLAIWNNDFLGAATQCRAALRAVPEALARLPAAADDGEQRQACPPGRPAGRRRDGADPLGRAGHQRPAFVLPARPPGDAHCSVRLHRLRTAAQSARPSARRADVEPVRADRGAGVRQDRGRGRCRRNAAELVPHRVFEGNRPTNTLLAERLTPAVLGALVALYEHSVFTQGTIWDIDSFDQWGVELGKTLALRTVPELESAAEPELATTARPMP